MQRYFIQLSYIGTNYKGWQIQPQNNTIQNEITKALCTVLKEKISITGAGRTDTGVHASFFIAHFDSVNNNLESNQKLIYNLNSILPNDIAIQKISRKEPNNHARFDATSRTYNYFISKKKNPFIKDTSYMLFYNFNLDMMNKACTLLFEYEDFTSFSKLHTDVKTNNCNIIEAFWEEKDEQIVFTITANRFLRNMVRSIVGTMLDIGLGKTSINNFKEIIEKKDRKAAGRSVPAKGLFLSNIIYPY